MKKLNKKQEEQLKEAFSALCNLYYASEKDNFSQCTAFHIKPFNTHWDKRTIKEVMNGIKLYLSSWVIHPMEKALEEDRVKIKSDEQKYHKEKKKISKKILNKK